MKLPLIPAVCGKVFEVELCDVGLPSQHQAPARQLASIDCEMSTQLRYYTLSCVARLTQRQTPRTAVLRKNAGSSHEPNTADEVVSNFFSSAAEPKTQSECGIETWLRAVTCTSPSGKHNELPDLGSKDLRRVQRAKTLPSGATFTIIDSQPAKRASADRAFANQALWEALPRGHAEVREGDETGVLLCQLAAMRKFGSAEEKFGPLASEAGGARRCALSALPAAMKKLQLRCKLSLVFSTKDSRLDLEAMAQRLWKFCATGHFSVAR